MNKEKLKKYIKKQIAEDVNFQLMLYKKQVLFYLYSYDNREVCNIEIPYNDRLDKKSIYVSIADLIHSFDFSFRVTFENTKNIYEFIEGLNKYK